MPFLTYNAAAQMNDGVSALNLNFLALATNANLIKACGQRLAFSVRYFASLWPTAESRDSCTLPLTNPPSQSRRQNPLQNALLMDRKSTPATPTDPAKR